MQKRYIFTFFVGVINCLVSGIEFADDSSTLQVKTGVRLNVAGTGQLIDGTLKHDDGSTIDGLALAFATGTVERDNTTAVLTGTYDADASPTIILDGSDKLDAGRNFTVHGLTISGDSNTLAGSPVLAGGLTLPTDVDLRCDLTSSLNKTITLDGGTLTLDNNLVCANDVTIAGTGTVDLNGYKLLFASYHSAALTSNLTFTDARNLELQSKTPLAGDWTFTGTSSFDGKGSVLDLRHGGTLTIGTDSRLTLRDMQIKGVSDASIIFTDATSILELDRSQLELTADITTTEGKIEITGDSTWVMRGYDWTINTDARLTVDTSSLFLNVLNQSDLDDIGTVYAPRATYVDHLKKLADIDLNVADGNMLFIGGGVISETGERLGEELLTGGVSGEVVLDKSTLMAPGDVITIAEDATIDGTGSRILFARPETAQFAVAADVTVLLKNIELHGITQNTFELGVGSKVQIGENVIFSLAGDVTWAKEQLELTGTDTSFELRSLGAPRKFCLSSLPITGARPLDYVYQQHLNLNTNSLVLNNVTLCGLKHITYSTAIIDGVSVTGGIVLNGDATVEVHEALVPHTFVAKGLKNTMRLYNDDVTFTGAVRYDATAISALHLSFLLPATFYGIPRVYLGDGALTISSTSGQAYFYADTHRVQLVNNVAGSCVLGANGFLAGNVIDVDLNPIKQTSAHAALCPGVQVTTGLASGAIVMDTDLLDAMRAPKQRSATTWFELLEKRRQEWALEYDQTRGISLPNELFKPVAHYGSAFALPAVAGNIRLRESQGAWYTNWQMSTTRAANMTLDGGVRIIQGQSATTIKSDDIINIIGGTLEQPNIIQLDDDVIVNGTLMLDDDAVVHIRCVPDGVAPIITWAAGSDISFGDRSIVVVSGEGTMVLSDSFLLNLGANNGRLVISDGMKLQVTSAATVKFGGVGSVICDRGGQLVVEDGSHLICGTAYTDNITLRAKVGGSVRVGDTFATDASLSSYLSFARTSGSLDFSHGGTLVIAERGVCECNSLLESDASGSFDRLDFSSGGLLYIASGGTMRINDNIGGAAGITTSFHGGQVSGAGTVGLGNTGFLGKVQNNIFSAASLSAAALVRNLIQTNSLLPHATAFIQEDGLTGVRTKNGQLVTLVTGEVITGELDDGMLSGYNSAKRQRFTYTADGVRSS